MSTAKEYKLSQLKESTEDQLTSSDGNTLHKPKTTELISVLQSVTVPFLGTKSESQMKRESKEKQKKIDHLMPLAEKVHTINNSLIPNLHLYL